MKYKGLVLMTVAAMSACFFAVPVHADENPNIPLEDQEEICDYFVIQHAYDVMKINLNYVLDWTDEAYQSGFTYDTTPSANSVAIFKGHVAWVDSVNGDQMYIEEGGYYEPSEGRKILHQGWIPSTIGSHEYPSNPDSPVLKGFLHLENRKVVDPTIIINEEYNSFGNTTFKIDAKFYDDRTHNTSPSDAGILLGQSKDAVQKASVDSHANAELVSYSNPNKIVARWNRAYGGNQALDTTTYEHELFF